MVGEVRRVLLVGFMGSGKTSVGQHVATALGWRFVDADAAIEAETGMPISEIFRTRGEAAFRAMEARQMLADLSKENVVIASGGGWAAKPGWVEAIGEGTVSIWLKVTAAEAVRRAKNAPGTRPLLSGAEPLNMARELVAARSVSYAGAAWKVDTEGSSVEDVAARILMILAATDP
ncbi:MAG: shikimate kinase [Gemmatimonadetes bacterium]|jgi:shikimate kinase|nr:shikimate kinase [Gemmatimonadota bacterium]